MHLKTQIASFYLPKIAIIFFLIFCSQVDAESQLSPKKNVTIGIYLSSIYELDMSAGSYSADFWIWSESPIKQKFSLDEVELGLLHGKFPIDASLKYKENLNNSISFENRKIRGTFLHDFNLSLFPFDKQVLRFSVEGTDSTEKMNFFLSPYSGFNKSILISGWHINDFKLLKTDVKHNTNFGYPKFDVDVKYPLIVAEIELVRDSPYLFLKLSIGLFIAVLIAALSSAMNVRNNDLYGSRVALLGGALLAAVLNQQFADSKAGGITSITLIDLIHLVGISMIGCLFIATILFRYLCTKEGWKLKIQKIDVFFGALILISFTIISAIIVTTSI
jgi:hypothetical protein